MSKQEKGGQDKGMTAKQRMFADYYIELGNATEAAIKAGYSPKSARSQASTNLQKPAVKAYVEGIMAGKDKERIASQDEILMLLTAIARGKERGTALVGAGMGEQVVRQVPPTLSERTRAAELLGRRYGMFKDKQEISGNVGVVIIDDTGEDEDDGD